MSQDLLDSTSSGVDVARSTAAKWPFASPSPAPVRGISPSRGGRGVGRRWLSATISNAWVTLDTESCIQNSVPFILAKDLGGRR